jgi:murein DD-endopeptidase MepM/ murein hydrolase activator NlpD
LIAGTAAALAVGVALAMTAPAQAPGSPVGAVSGAEGAARSSPSPADRGNAPASRGTGTRVTTMDVAPSHEPGPPPVGTLGGYQWPLPKARLTLPFGPSPWGSRLIGGKLFHDGVDLATFCGDRVVAAHAGRVLAAGRHYDAVMGWVGDIGPYLRRLEAKHLWSTLPIVVVVDDGNGYRSIYAHFGKVVVKKGQRVNAGQLLGYEGQTGRASGCHLHYGLYSPLEHRTFRIEASVVKRMKVPKHQIARIDPLLVLPPRPKPSTAPTNATASPDPTPSADSP